MQRSGKGVCYPDARPFEVVGISRGNDQTMNQRGCCDQTVLDGHRPPRGAQVREKTCPAQATRRIPGQAMDTSDAFLKPLLQLTSPPAGRQKVDSEPDLPQKQQGRRLSS